jgi:transcription termination factor NusB
LERWLSDHNNPYPTPADLKDLERIVQDNWQTRVVDSYKNWDAPQLQSYLSDVGKELDKKQKADKNWLVQQVKGVWHETEKTAENAWESVKDWIFDS